MYSPQDIFYRTILIFTFLVAVALIGIIYFCLSYQRQFLRSNLRRVIFETEALENERLRLAADLHDEIGPLISFCKIKAEKLNASSVNIERDVNELSDLLNDILSRIRWMSNMMMPEALLEKGVVFAINELKGKVIKDTGLTITFQSVNVPEIPVSTGIHIFRIIQEIIHNTVKHAKAKSLKIHLYVSRNELLIRTADDGIGFDTDKVYKNGSGLGMRILNNRTTILGGDLNLQSIPGSGTSYHITIPNLNQLN
jgi:signal transduction histidine kinase